MTEPWAWKNPIALALSETFKAHFLSWWGESEHQGWDGFDKRDVEGFEKVMKDFSVFLDTLSELDENRGHMVFGSHELDMQYGDPPLTEAEEKEFADWMEIWSPSDCVGLLPDYMSPSMKRAVVKELHAQEETDGDS